MSGLERIMAWYEDVSQHTKKCSRVCDYTGRQKELKTSENSKLPYYLIIMSRTKYVENDVRRFLKAKSHVRIHETRLLCSQSIHDLPQSPECCSPTKQARDAQPTHCDEVNVVLLFLHTINTFPSCCSVCHQIPNFIRMLIVNEME